MTQQAPMPAPASPGLRETFRAFRGLSMWLRKCFNTYRYLFEGDAKTKEVMEKSAAWFFTDLQDILQQHCWLQACKITDPATSYSKTAKARVDNLTVDHLCAALKAEKLNTADTDRLALELMNYRPLVVEARDRVISHADKTAHLQDQPIGGHAKQDLDQFLQNLQDFNDAVGNAIGEGPLDFRYMPADGDAGDLIYMLRAGLKANGKL